MSFFPQSAIPAIAALSFMLAAAFPPRQAGAALFTPQGDLIGEVTHYRVEEGDNLYQIARRHDIGIVELLTANPGIDPWLPEVGTELTITAAHILPDAPRRGIVINLPELRLFYYMPDGSVMSVPIGIGREGWQTPTGTTTIVKKRDAPTWTPPPSIRAENPELPDIIPPGPDNPLGAYALNLAWRGFVIHGTNRPYGVGRRSSHGCIRLYPEDISTLFPMVRVGTTVTILDTPYKLGWREDTLFLEVTPSQRQTDTIAEYRRPLPLSIPEIYDAILKAADDATSINWYAIELAIAEHSGIPTAIANRSTSP